MGLFLLKYLDDWFIKCDEDIQFPCISYRIPLELTDFLQVIEIQLVINSSFTKICISVEF